MPKRAKTPNIVGFSMPILTNFAARLIPWLMLFGVLVPAAVSLPCVSYADAPAAATGKQKVLILRAESGAVADGPRMALTKEVFGHAAKYRQLEIVQANADLVEEMFEFECTEAGVECLGRIGNKYGAQLVVYSEIAKAGAGLQLNMRVIDVTAGRVAQTTQQTLDLDKPASAIARALVVLLGPVDMPSSTESPGKLKVSLFGGGTALIYVDDQMVGNTEDKGGLSVAAGSHTVRIVRAGFREWSGRVTVPSGQTVEKMVALEQMANVPAGKGDGSDRSITQKWWFWTIVGGVVVAGATTAILLATQKAKTPTGAASFTLDSNNAHLDPVFSSGTGQ